MSAQSILWVEGSPKGEQSLSSSCARAFLDALGDGVTVKHLRYLFDFLGFELAESLIIEPITAWTHEERQTIVDDAIARARQAGIAW